MLSHKKESIIKLDINEFFIVIFHNTEAKWFTPILSICILKEEIHSLKECIFTQPFRQMYGVTQDQFLSREKLSWIQSFLSPKLVAIPKLKNPVCPIYLVDSCFSQG